MPGQLDHLARAQHNENFVNSFDFDTAVFLDWTVNGIFYSALHYVESYLATVGVHSPSHPKRNRAFQKYPFLKPIWRPYRTLKDESEKARYKLAKFKPGDVRDLLSQEFNSIKTHILPPSTVST